MHITFVKKILADGNPCAKCGDVEQRLNDSGLINRIDEVVVADERDPTSVGMALASELGVERAPFFVVRDADEIRVHTVYFKFVKQELGGAVSDAAADQETLRDNPELDLI